MRFCARNQQPWRGAGRADSGAAAPDKMRIGNKTPGGGRYRVRRYGRLTGTRLFGLSRYNPIEPVSDQSPYSLG
jgi:hypothetical protein